MACTFSLQCCYSQIGLLTLGEPLCLLFGLAKASPQALGSRCCQDDLNIHSSLFTRKGILYRLQVILRYRKRNTTNRMIATLSHFSNFLSLPWRTGTYHMYALNMFDLQLQITFLSFCFYLSLGITLCLMIYYKRCPWNKTQEIINCREICLDLLNLPVFLFNL